MYAFLTAGSLPPGQSLSYRVDSSYLFLRELGPKSSSNPATITLTNAPILTLAAGLDAMGCLPLPEGPLAHGDHIWRGIPEATTGPSVLSLGGQQTRPRARPPPEHNTEFLNVPDQGVAGWVVWEGSPQGMGWGVSGAVTSALMCPQHAEEAQCGTATCAWCRPA